MPVYGVADLEGPLVWLRPAREGTVPIPFAEKRRCWWIWPQRRAERPGRALSLPVLHPGTGRSSTAGDAALRSRCRSCWRKRSQNLLPPVFKPALFTVGSAAGAGHVRVHVPSICPLLWDFSPVPACLKGFLDTSLGCLVCTVSSKFREEALGTWQDTQV